MAAAGIRREQLEVDVEDASSGLAERFLAACRVGPAERAAIATTAAEAAREHGTATIDVRMTAPRPEVEVLPGNVVNIKAAATPTAGIVSGMSNS
jgi:hypothetical protein